MTTPEEQNTEVPVVSQADYRILLAEKMKMAVRLTMVAVIEEELEVWCGAGRYERSPNRRDQRIGTRYRDLGTTVGLIEDLPVPRTRKRFQTQLFEKYHRRQAELDQAIGEMFVKGISTLQVGAVMETLNNIKPSPSTVSRVFHKLQEDYDTWKKRDLPNRYVYAFADAFGLFQCNLWR